MAKCSKSRGVTVKRCGKKYSCRLKKGRMVCKLVAKAAKARRHHRRKLLKGARSERPAYSYPDSFYENSGAARSSPSSSAGPSGHGLLGTRKHRKHRKHSKK